MTLIFCPQCDDVVKLRAERAHRRRTCICGESWGGYEGDELHAVIGGQAVSIGFGNTSFYRAVNQQPEAGAGNNFTAFVIPKKCPTIRRAK